MSRRSIEWWQAEAAMHLDRADRAVAAASEAEDRARRFEALATVASVMVLRAGVKPRTDDEKRLLSWAETSPHVTTLEKAA